MYKASKGIFTLFLLLSIFSCGDSDNPPPNTVPIIVIAAPLEVNELETLTLKATASDVDGTIASYAWLQDSGTEVTLSGSDTDSISFTTPDIMTDEELVFSLVVTDNLGASASAKASITVKFINNLPVIEVNGPTKVVELEAVTLKAIASDTDGTITAYAWVQVSGSTVVLSGSETDSISFTAPDVLVDEVLTFNVFATDDLSGMSVKSISLDLKHLITLADVTVQVSNILPNQDSNSAIGSTSTEIDTSFKTYGKVTYLSSVSEFELHKISEFVWQGTGKNIPTGVDINIETSSTDFAGFKTYQTNQLVSSQTTGISVEQLPVLPEEITETSVNKCELYVDDSGAIYPIKSIDSESTAFITKQVGFYKDKSFIPHNECGPAYVQHYKASGNLEREVYYLNGFTHNLGDFSGVHYNDAIHSGGTPIKNVEYRKDKNGHFYLLDDTPSEIQYYPSGNVSYKLWRSTADILFLRQHGPDSMHYADTTDNYLDTAFWYSDEQIKQKRKTFYANGTPSTCSYYNDAGTDIEIEDLECLNEVHYDQVYFSDSYEEPNDVCKSYIDDAGVSYPVYEQVDAHEYKTTGYTKNGQYIYHNVCEAAMTTYFASGNKHQQWSFVEGVNTNPNGFTSFSFYDLLDDENQSILEMESKIEEGYYVLINDQPSVIKYYTNGDIQYKAWMKTTIENDWVYGRTSGPDVINYGYGMQGYQQKDLYWYNEESVILKRKYYNDDKGVAFCAYYENSEQVESDSGCLNEDVMDKKYNLL